jgi:hypothetical protein
MTVRIAVLVGVLALAVQPALAQDESSTTGQTVPKTDVTGKGSLSDKLSDTNGVIHPTTNVDPKMNKPAPVPDPNSTPVIPPPGSPGGDPNVQPK